MPLYDYKCKDGHLTEGWNKVADRHDSPLCDVCKGETELTISSPSNVNPDIEPFQCTGFDHDMQETAKTRTPRYFRSRKHMNDELKARGLSIANPKTRWF